MDQVKSTPWVVSCKCAFIERDPKKMIELIGMAESAIDARLFDLRNDTDHHEERQLMSDAQSNLGLLRREQEALEVRISERTADLKKSEQNLHKLAGRLLYMRDDERRRLARELHDSVGQALTAISTDIAVVQRESDRLSPTAAKATSETADLIQQVLREIRTMSHLLHPPLLDECGLLPAIRWYAEGFAQRSNIAEGFAQRSNIKVSLKLDEDF